MQFAEQHLVQEAQDFINARISCKRSGKEVVDRYMEINGNGEFMPVKGGIAKLVADFYASKVGVGS